MLRLTDIKLPLDHPADAIEQAVLQKLAISKAELIDFTVFKRGYDARKKNNILLIYLITNYSCIGHLHLSVIPDEMVFVSHLLFFLLNLVFY